MAEKKASKKDTAKPAKKRRSTSVPDSYRGFSLQATRFLFYLLKAKTGDTVSLEYFEDVGVERADGTKVAEQDKSYLSSNPLTDRSVVFWKALRNWIDAANEGVLPPTSSHFIAYAPAAHMGVIVQAFHDATTIDDAKAALNKARVTLTSGGKWDISEAAQDHVKVVFGADETVVAQVITRFTVDSTQERPEDVLKAVLLDKLVGEDSFDSVIRWAHGWVKQRIDACLERGEPARVAQKAFHEPLLNFVQTHDRVNILRSVAGAPTDEQVKEEVVYRDYVKQLRVIDLDDIDILQAVNDFLSASIDRTVWSDEGMISQQSLDVLERELTTTWRNKQRKTQIAFSSKPSHEQGQLTYSECMDHAARLDGLDTPTHFIRGSFHALADDRTIGWHPEYASAMDRFTAGTDP
jgi:hypothetical protein